MAALSLYGLGIGLEVNYSGAWPGWRNNAAYKYCVLGCPYLCISVSPRRRKENEMQPMQLPGLCLSGLHMIELGYFVSMVRPYRNQLSDLDMRILDLLTMERGMESSRI